MIFDAFIKELRAIPGLEDLKPDHHGRFSLRINHIHTIYFSESSNKLLLYIFSPLCPIPFDKEQKIALFDQLLSANLFSQNSGKGCFAKDKDQIIYLSSIPVELLTKEQFISDLQQFIECLSHWKKEISEFPTFPFTLTKESSSFIKP